MSFEGVQAILWSLVGLTVAFGIGFLVRGMRLNRTRERGNSHRPAMGGRVVATALAVATTSALIGGVTWAGFSATTASPNNTFTAGTVTISDNDSGASMLALANAVPDDSDTSCITVSYAGTADANVRLYGTTAGTGLDAYLNLTVTRGTGAAGFDNCTGFTPDPTDYIGAGAGVVYAGTLQGYPDTSGAAVVDPKPGTPETWTSGETHQYRLAVTVQDNSSAQGLSATQTFTWEALGVS